MSSYTTQVRTLIEHYTQETPDIPLQEKIEKGREKFFDFDYPFFDEDYKEIFETNFLKYFYLYEIGQETEGLFKFRLDTWLNTNMFYYNKLFESEQLNYNPIENVNVSRKRKRNNNVMESDITARKGKANTTSESKSNQSEKQNSTQKEKQQTNLDDKGFTRDIQSDTPENRLQLTSNPDGSGTVEYASSINENKQSGQSETKTDSSGESTGNRTGESVGQSDAKSEMTNEENRDKTLSECETETDTQQGKIGSATYQEMILEYRKTFLNVERQIFENMRKDGLFMLVYN